MKSGGTTSSQKQLKISFKKKKSTVKRKKERSNSKVSFNSSVHDTADQDYQSEEGEY